MERIDLVFKGRCFPQKREASTTSSDDDVLSST
jgi:hypothetical protein